MDVAVEICAALGNLGVYQVVELKFKLFLEALDSHFITFYALVLRNSTLGQFFHLNLLLKSYFLDFQLLFPMHCV